MDHLANVYVRGLFSTPREGKSTYYEAWVHRTTAICDEAFPVSFFEGPDNNWRAALIERARLEQIPIRITYHDEPHYLPRLDTVQLTERVA